MKTGNSIIFQPIIMLLAIASSLFSCSGGGQPAPVTLVPKEAPKSDITPMGNAFNFLRVGNELVYNSTENGVLATADTLTFYLYNLKNYYCLRKMLNLSENISENRPHKIYEELFFVKDVNFVLVGREHYYKVDTLAKLNPPAGETWFLPRDTVSSPRFDKYKAYKIYSYFGPHRFDSDLKVEYTGEKEVITVPAGKFECVKLIESSPDSSMYGYTYFNNQVGLIKREIKYRTGQKILTREIFLVRKKN